MRSTGWRPATIASLWCTSATSNRASASPRGCRRSICPRRRLIDAARRQLRRGGSAPVTSRNVRLVQRATRTVASPRTARARYARSRRRRIAPARRPRRRRAPRAERSQASGRREIDPGAARRGCRNRRELQRIERGVAANVTITILGALARALAADVAALLRPTRTMTRNVGRPRGRSAPRSPAKRARASCLRSRRGHAKRRVARWARASGWARAATQRRIAARRRSPPMIACKRYARGRDDPAGHSPRVARR